MLKLCISFRTAACGCRCSCCSCCGVHMYVRLPRARHPSSLIRTFPKTCNNPASISTYINDDDITPSKYRHAKAEKNIRRRKDLRFFCPSEKYKKGTSFSIFLCFHASIPSFFIYPINRSLTPYTWCILIELFTYKSDATAEVHTPYTTC